MKHANKLAIRQQPALLLPSVTTLSEDEIAAKSKNELATFLLSARDEVHALTQENKGLTQEIHVLTQALAVSGNNLGLEQDCDLRSVLLYDLALSQQARATLAIDLARRTEKMKSLQKAVSTLSFVREANNLELLKCERKIKGLEHQVASQHTQVSMAVQNQDRFTSMMAAHHQLSEQLSASQLRTASTERERDHLAAQLPRITRLSQEAESQRSQLQAQHQQQLDALRTQHVEQLDVLREQHKLQIEAAQKEVERYQQQLTAMRDQHVHQMAGEQALKDKREQQWRKETEQVIQQYEYEHGCLRAQLEQANAVTEKGIIRIRSEHVLEKQKLQDRITELIKEIENLKTEIVQLKSREGDAQGKLASLRAEYARQGRINSFQEVVGVQMANVRTQLEEAKQIYNRVNAENALLAAENARLLLLLDEELKSKSYARATSPHLPARPSSTPPLIRASLKIPAVSSPLATPIRPSSAPQNFSSASPLQNFISSSPTSSPETIRRQKHKTQHSNPSNPVSRSSPEPSETYSSTLSDFSQLIPSDLSSSSRSTSPILLIHKSSINRSPLLAHQAAARTSSPTQPSSSSPSPSNQPGTTHL